MSRSRSISKNHKRSQSSSRSPSPSLINDMINYLIDVKHSSTKYISNAIQQHGKKGVFMLIACLTIVALYKLIQTNYGNIVSEKFLEYSSYIVEYSMSKMSWAPISVQKIIVKLHNTVQTDPSALQHILPTLPTEVQQVSNHFIALPETSSFLSQLASIIGSVAMTTTKYSLYTVLAGVIGTFLLVTKIIAECLLFTFLEYFYSSQNPKPFFALRKFANMLSPILTKQSNDALFGYNKVSKSVYK